MPPRYVYWTILIDQQPTAFRAKDQEDLLPTLHQLRRTNKDVVMKWFARGKLWESPEAERAAQQKPRFAETRGQDWRPGGLHKDPRARFDKRKRADRPPPRDREPSSIDPQTSRPGTPKPSFPPPPPRASGGPRRDSPSSFRQDFGGPKPFAKRKPPRRDGGEPGDSKPAYRPPPPRTSGEVRRDAPNRERRDGGRRDDSKSASKPTGSWPGHSKSSGAKSGRPRPGGSRPFRPGPPHPRRDRRK